MSKTPAISLAPTVDAVARIENIPLRFGDDPYVWAAWLYYEDHLTQAEIADVMRISRPTVNAYLASAREKGVVNISVDPARLSSLGLAQQFKDRFGLGDCAIIPTANAGSPLIERLGIAGAMAMRKLLRPADTLAVVWGRTVRSVGAHLALPPLDDVTIVQATGGAGARFDYTPEICASTIAQTVGARYVPLTAPMLVSSAEMRQLLLEEPLLRGQFEILASANKALFGIESLRQNSTVHSSGLYAPATLQHYLDSGAVGIIASRFIDVKGRPVPGPLDNSTVGISLEMLRGIGTRIAIAGGLEKVDAILAAIRGGFVSVLITDVPTARAVLQADGAGDIDRRTVPRPIPGDAPSDPPRIKKFVNNPDDVETEVLEGAVAAYGAWLMPIRKSNRALVARTGPRPGKVGLVLGSGIGHEPGYLGFIGKGLADAIAIGNIFAAPPPDPIFDCVQAASGGRGVLMIHASSPGDVINFSTAASYARNSGIDVRRVATSDDLASAEPEDKASRRGIAGSMLVIKAAGAACDLGWPLDECEAIARRANDHTLTIGVALEAAALPQTGRRNFVLGANEIEVGVGIHGGLGVTRASTQSADAIADSMFERIFAELALAPGERVAVLVNSLGATPMMELLLLYRRVEQRLAAKRVDIAARWVGAYCTALDTAGASISLMRLDAELETLLAYPCDSPALRVG